MKTKAAGLLLFASLALALQPPRKPAKKTEPFLDWLLRVTGISATSRGLKGDTPDLSGDIWIADIGGGAGAKQRLTFEGGYRWPIFSMDDRSIIAICGANLCSIPAAGGDSVKLPHSIAGIERLIGAAKDGVVLATATDIGIFSPQTGAFTAFAPQTQADRDAMDRMRKPARSYGGTEIYQEGSDIVVRRGDSVQNRTEGTAQRYGQPSLSHSPSDKPGKAVYIKAM